MTSIEQERKKKMRDWCSLVWVALAHEDSDGDAHNWLRGGLWWRSACVKGGWW